jgi:excisionase family DNA binding protein
MPSLRPDQDRLSLLVADIRSLSSLLEQIAYISRLRDPDTGVYRSPAIPASPRAPDIHLALCHLHENVFRKWLNLGLDGQKAELEVYLAGYGRDRPAVVRTWLNLESYRLFVPASASPAEKGLFFDTVKTLLRMHSIALGAQSDEGDAAMNDGPLLTLKEVSATLLISQRTLRHWAVTGGIPAIKVGRKWRFRRNDIQNWLRTRSE